MSDLGGFCEPWQSRDPPGCQEKLLTGIALPVLPLGAAISQWPAHNVLDKLQSIFHEVIFISLLKPQAQHVNYFFMHIRHNKGPHKPCLFPGHTEMHTHKQTHSTQRHTHTYLHSRYEHIDSHQHTHAYQTHTQTYINTQPHTHTNIYTHSLNNSRSHVCCTNSHPSLVRPPGPLWPGPRPSQVSSLDAHSHLAPRTQAPRHAPAWSCVLVLPSPRNTLPEAPGVTPSLIFY